MKADKKRRRLIWAPIVHGQADLGSAAESVRAIYTRRIGNKEWDRHVEAIAFYGTFGSAATPTSRS